MFRKILIANRGEIALRILRCCKAMGIKTVVIHSTADQESMAVMLADQSVCIGPPQAAASYLNKEQILEVALSTGCEAIHPGFGFLSENDEFAQMCEEHGVAFIGPSGDIIRKMGNKQAARELMIANAVPVVPGSQGLVESVEEAARIAEEIGYPVLLKASAGGGGRGMRRAYSPEDIQNAYLTAKAEAEAAFGNGDMYLEKLINNPHHIEFQILADKQGHVIQLGERDCSIQRRNQKMMEESPAKCLTDEMRRDMAEAAVKAAVAAGYYSAGTIEFVVDEKKEHFYFIEMNTRIQVEHPVTEMVTGMDLIREQIRIAAGLPLSVSQEEVQMTGHAIECRINAEIPEKNFVPSPGRVNFLHLPAGNGVRVDTALYPGYEMSPYYDSMVAKIIVHAPGRLEAIKRMRAALEELMIEGIHTNTEFLFLIMYNPAFMKGEFDTSFIEENLEGLLDWKIQSQLEIQEDIDHE